MAHEKEIEAVRTELATQSERDAMQAADEAGVKSPAGISDTAIPSTSELHQRVQALEMAKSTPVQPMMDKVDSLQDRVRALEMTVERATPNPDHAGKLAMLEALVMHLFETQFRTASIPDIMKWWTNKQAGSPVLDHTARGR